MRCPFCTNPETKVIDSRLVTDGAQVKRRRACEECKLRFTTFEIYEVTLPKVIKADGARETFDPNKIRKGVDRALEKRPVAAEQVETLLERIQRRLQAMSEREIPSSKIGELVMSELKTLDAVAYVRFASVYKSFEDLQDFVSAINEVRE